MKKTTTYALISGALLSSLIFYACQEEEHNKDAAAPLPLVATKYKSAAAAATVDSSCFLNTAKCVDPDCQVTIAMAHIISDSSFNSMHNEYISIYNPKIKSTKYDLSRFKKMDYLNCEEKDHIGFSMYDNAGDISISFNDIELPNGPNKTFGTLEVTTLKANSTTTKKKTITKTEADSVKAEQTILGRYSIALFKGLIAKYGLTNTDTVEFFKIVGYEKDGNKKPSVALKILDKVSGKPVYADLSQYYP